ncbi:MAG: DUF2085 domain-containing protein [Planctomycetes bacterium]|nr:DUF2085 domain-containing protein [Planctomycetota bacterium]
MDALTSIFSHVCGQGRPFVLDGAPLPVCQRCLGLYGGAALTAAWLLASGLWRRALPDRSVALAQIAMLLAAMAGGLSLADLGPAWRLLCGLWTGHVALAWLWGGANHLLALSRPGPFVDPPWPRGLRAGALAAGPALAAVALMFARYASTGWLLASVAAAAGAAFLALALIRAAVAAGWWARWRLSALHARGQT